MGWEGDRSSAWLGGRCCRMTHPFEPHIDLFEPSSNPRHSGKLNCPACGGDNLSINRTTYAHECFDNGCTARQILDVINPLDRADRAPTHQRPVNRRIVTTPPSATSIVLTSADLTINIARLESVPDDIPVSLRSPRSGTRYCFCHALRLL
jgi:hypothetical protein